MPFAGCRFAHASNACLDATLRGVGPVSDDRTLVRDATLSAFETLVTTCLERELDFLLLAGGTFDTRDTSHRARVAFRDGVECLDEAGIATVVVPGPHDPPGFWSRFGRLPQSVIVVDPHADRPTSIPGGDGRPLAVLHTARSAGAERHRRFDGSHAEPRPARLLVTDHAVDPHGFDFVALTGEGPRSSAGQQPLIHHAGSLQPTHPTTGPCGTFTHVEIDDHRRTITEAIPAAVVRWERIEHELAAGLDHEGDVQRFAERLVDELSERIDEPAELRIVTWAVTGDPRTWRRNRREVTRRFDELWNEFGSGSVLHRWEERPSRERPIDDGFTASVVERIRGDHVPLESLLADVSDGDLYARLGRDLDRGRVLARAEADVLAWLHDDIEGGHAA